jgi:NAD(P)-dependent dehydrogenase (short-subunit alcohol dehydrogenase family)
VQQQIEQAGRKAVLVPCDISDPAQARSLVDRVASELDGLDILVNNAATSATTSTSTTSPG